MKEREGELRGGVFKKKLKKTTFTYRRDRHTDRQTLWTVKLHFQKGGGRGFIA